MRRLGHEFDLLVVDEVHHFGLGVREEALKMFVARERLGLTATLPDDARSHEALVGPVIYRQRVADLAGTWLASFELMVVHLGFDPDERACYDADMRIFLEVNRQSRRMYPPGTWQEFMSSASVVTTVRASGSPLAVG